MTVAMWPFLYISSGTFMHLLLLEVRTICQNALLFMKNDFIKRGFTSQSVSESQKKTRTDDEKIIIRILDAVKIYIVFIIRQQNS